MSCRGVGAAGQPWHTGTHCGHIGTPLIQGRGIQYMGSRMSVAMDSILGKVMPTWEHACSKYLECLMPMWQGLRIEKQILCHGVWPRQLINAAADQQITPGWLYLQCVSLSPNSWNSTGKPLDWCPTVCIRPHLMVSRCFITATACRSGALNQVCSILPGGPVHEREWMHLMPGVPHVPSGRNGGVP